MADKRGVKRRKTHSFACFRINEFADWWTRSATEEEKDWVTSYFQKTGFSRALTQTPWMKDRETFQTASTQFWILVAQHLLDVPSVISFSRISKVHYRVARMDIVYERWNSLYLKSQRFYSNPFVDLPLWKQFLVFSGTVPLELWRQWNEERTECFFFYALVYEKKFLPQDFVFDLESKSIQNSTGQVVCSIGSFGRLAFGSHEMPYLSRDGTSDNWPMNRIMRQ